MKLQKVICFLLVPLLIVSCKKDSDEQDPTVTILSPTNGQSYHVFDTILVDVNVSDDHIVERVSATLVDNGIAASRTVSRDVNAISANVKLEIPIDDIHLETKDYSLRVRATDGPNEENKFVSLFVQEEPLRFRGLISLNTSGNSVTVNRLDSAFNNNAIATTPMDLSAASISNYHQQVHIGGGINGDLLALDVDDGSISWSVPNLNIGTLTYFRHLACENEQLLVYESDADGFIKGFNQFGGVSFNATALAGYRSDLTWTQAGRLISAQSAIAGSDRQLVVYFSPSGAIEANHVFDKELIAAFERQETSALLFGNRSGDAVIQTMEVDLGLGFEPRTISGQQFVAVEQITSDVYLIATGSNLYRYRYQTNDLQNVASGISVRSLDYDPLTGAVYAASGSQVLAIDPSNGNSTTLAGLSGNTQWVFPVYNK